MSLEPEGCCDRCSRHVGRRWLRDGQWICKRCSNAMDLHPDIRVGELVFRYCRRLSTPSLLSECYRCPMLPTLELRDTLEGYAIARLVHQRRGPVFRVVAGYFGEVSTALYAVSVSEFPEFESLILAALEAD